MQVPFADIKTEYISLWREIDDVIDNVLSNGSYILGNEVEAFEKEFADYCGVKHCIGVSNGLDALTLTLRAYGIGPGDEVIVPAFTFIATWLAVSNVGASIVPVDVKESTFNIDPALIEEKITERTKAVIAVHLYGQTVELNEIKNITDKYKLKLIEDAAQAHGAEYLNQKAGSLGDTACFSFYPVKNLGALGDGGAVVSNDKSIIDKINSLRNYGSSQKYIHDQIGYNCRLDEIQAAVLRVKLKKLDQWNTKRRVIADKYFSGLNGIKELVLPDVCFSDHHVWHQFVIKCDGRDELKEFLAGNGIQTIIHYPIPLFKQNAYKEFFPGSKYRFPAAEKLSDSVLSLPVHPSLDEIHQNKVIDLIQRFYSE